jgi:hypothetical protein
MPDFMLKDLIETALISLTFMVIGFPLVRAIGIRLTGGGAASQKRLAEVNERLQRIEQAVDSIAVEVERSTEAQRFTAKLLAERGVDAPGSDRAGSKRLS